VSNWNTRLYPWCPAPPPACDSIACPSNVPSCAACAPPQSAPFACAP
jgi:hypothetical protein